MATACYIAEYLPASYKGVPFDAMDATSEHGRRGAAGEFPFGEDTAYADLGRRIRKYTLKARFPENSHIADTDALIAAVETPGSGPLFHPTRGLVMAACTSMKVKDDIYDEQGVTYADLEFIEGNEVSGGFELGGSFVGLVVNTVIDIAMANFNDNYDLRLIPFHRRDQVRGTAANIISQIRQEYASATYATADSKVYRALSDFDTLLTDPILLDEEMTKKAIAFGIASVAASLSASAKLDAMRRIANTAAATSNLPAAAGAAQNATYALTRVTTGAFMAQAALETKFSTSDEAFRNLDIVMAVLTGEEQLAYMTCDNNLFITLRRFTIDAQSAIIRKAYQLPGLVQYDFGYSVHPLIAAYSILGDAKRHRELEVGNVISQSGRFGPVVTTASVG